MPTVTYLGPSRTLIYRGPSGQEYLFFGPGPSGEPAQPLQVDDKQDLTKIRSEINPENPRFRVEGDMLKTVPRKLKRIRKR